MVTALGLIIVPLALLWAYNPVRLLQLALISAVFEAAAAMVFGGFGLQPAMVPGLIFIGYILVQYALGMRYPGEGAALKAMLPLLALLFYALLSAWVLPHAFAGRLLVWPQKNDVLEPGFVPLQFTPGNVTQSMYLMVNVLFAAAAAVFLTRRSVPYDKIIGAYMAGGYLVVVLVFWQLGNRVAGVPFPEDLLHSNPGWAIVKQEFGSVPRVQGPFTEPAGLALYLSGICLCCLWLSVRGYSIMRPNLLLSLSIVSMLLSTSTTGIVTLVIGMPIVLAMASVGGDPHALARVGKTVGFLALAGLLAIGPIFVLKPGLVDAVSTVVDATLNKGDSESFDQRTEIDTVALDTVGPTYGLGVGWGSFRSSSFIPGLLANAGVFGAAMVLWCIMRLWRLGARGRAASRGHPGQILVDGFSASLCGQFAAALLSVPMIGSLAFFLQLGCVVGVLARMIIEPRLRARQRGSPSLASSLRTTEYPILSMDGASESAPTWPGARVPFSPGRVA